MRILFLGNHSVGVRVPSVHSRMAAIAGDIAHPRGLLHASWCVRVEDLRP